MQPNNIFIKQDDRRLRMFVDGTEIQGIRSLKFTTSIDEIPIIKLELYTPKVTLGINGEVLDVSEA